MSDGKLTLLIIALLVFGRSPFTEMAALPSDELIVTAQVAARYNFIGFAMGMLLWWFVHREEGPVVRHAIFAVAFLALLQGVFDIFGMYTDAPWGGIYPILAGSSLGLGLALMCWFMRYRFLRPFIELFGGSSKK